MQQLYIPFTNTQLKEIMKVYFEFDNIDFENDVLFFQSVKEMIDNNEHENFISIDLQSLYKIGKALHHLHLQDNTTDDLHQLYMYVANIVTRYKYKLNKAIKHN